jgi:hypothetical protein
MEPTRRHPLAGHRVELDDMGGPDQPLTGHRMTACGQPLEPHPVQSVQAEPGPQPAVQLGGCLSGGAVGAKVVVSLLAAALEVAPQVTANTGDHLGLELLRHEHPPPR